MVNKNLEKIVKYWQPRLKLSDWKLTIKFATDKQIEEYNMGFARTQSSFMSKAASILIKPLDKISSSISCTDIEVTVVHELIHLLVIPLKHNQRLSSEIEEHFVETMAIALVASRRGKKSI